MSTEVVNSWWKAEISRRFSTGTLESVRELVETLRAVAKPGQKVPGKSSIAAFVKELSEGNAVKPPPLPAAALEPGDRTPMAPDETVGMLTGFLRQQQAVVEGLTKREDLAGAQKALRQVTMLAALIEKIRRKDEDDGDVVRVKSSEMAAAAERARSKLHDLVSRLSEDKGKKGEAA